MQGKEEVDSRFIFLLYKFFLLCFRHLRCIRLDVLNAYILGYGFCYIVSGLTKDFYLIRPNFPSILTKILLLMVGVAHIFAAFYSFSPLLVSLALVESYSCVVHWSGKITWNGKLNDFHMAQSLYGIMSVFDLIDITFLLSKVMF